MNIPIILGTSRVGRRSAHVAQYLHSRLAAFPDVETRMLDLAEYAFPIMEERLLDMDPVPPALLDFSDAISQAQGILIVAPEYKGSYPGVLKNALDYLATGIFRRKPIGICTVSSGGFGGVNCLMQLRLLSLAMGGMPLPVQLPISFVKDWFDDDGVLLNTKLDDRADDFLRELLWYARALSNAAE